MGGWFQGTFILNRGGGGEEVAGRHYLEGSGRVISGGVIFVGGVKPRVEEGGVLEKRAWEQF